MLCSLFWISLPLKMGMIVCPKKSVRIYYSTLCNISDEWISHMMIWQCRPEFGSSWSVSGRSGLMGRVWRFVHEFKSMSHI